MSDMTVGGAIVYGTNTATDSNCQPTPLQILEKRFTEDLSADQKAQLHKEKTDALKDLSGSLQADEKLVLIGCDFSGMDLCNQMENVADITGSTFNDVKMDLNDFIRLNPAKGSYPGMILMKDGQELYRLNEDKYDNSTAAEFNTRRFNEDAGGIIPELPDGFTDRHNNRNTE